MEDLSKLKIDRSQKSQVTRPPRRTRRWPWLLLIVVAAIGGYAATGGDVSLIGLLTPKPKVEVATVTTAYPSQALTLFNATGYVVPQTKADVASKATGRLVELDVEEGTQVKKGQIIGKLENQDMVASMEKAEANRNAAEATVQQAQAHQNVDRAHVSEVQAELKDAERVLHRAKAMIGKKYVTEETYDAALARHDKARASLASAEATVVADGAAIAVAKAQVAAAAAAYHEAEVAVEYTRIRAPFDGVILSKHADIGDVVAPFASTNQSKGAVVSMADLATMQVEADVSESNLTKVKEGQPCVIELDALPDERLRGRVHMIVPTVDRAKATVMVKVAFIDKDPRILPEMSARVAFLSKPLGELDQKPRTVVPPAAIITRNGRPTVYRIDDDTLREVAIETGESLGDMTVVKTGLSPGEKIVLNPTEKLHDGLRVALPKT